MHMLERKSPFPDCVVQKIQVVFNLRIIYFPLKVSYKKQKGLQAQVIPAAYWNEPDKLQY